MKQKKTMIQYVLLLVVFLEAFAPWKADLSAADTSGEITFSVEKFTIGQGYLIEPTQVRIRQGQSVGDLVLSELKEHGYKAKLRTGSAFYLEGIYNADNGTYRVPAIILAMADMTGGSGQGLTPPTGKELNDDYPNLYEFSYMPSSGWMYTVNGEFPSLAMDGYPLKDGDIVRIQFTLYGYGGDLGERYANNPYVDIPDRNPLTRRLALMRKYKEICDGKGYSDAYDTAYAAAINMDISKTKFNAAFNALPAEEDIIYWGDQATAAEAGEKINAIGTVTLDKEAAITAARKAYDALTPAAQAMISAELTDILQKAETTLAQLKKEKADNEAASQVTAKINAIGKVTLDKEAAVSAARKAYDALNADAKKLVASSVLAKLTAAEAKIASLKKDAALKKKYTPAKVVLKAPKPGRKKIKLTWKKISKATGYQIYMSTKKSSGYKKIATIKKVKTVTYTRKNLKSKKDYYFKIRAYRKVGKKTYYGAWSKVKKAKAK